MMPDAASVIFALQQLADPTRLAGMKRYAIGNDHTLGVTLPDIRTLGKTLRKSGDQNERHALALALWKSGIHEARILASLVEDPTAVTKKQMDDWTYDFYSWDICDQVCGNLFHHLPFFLERAFTYSHAKTAFVKRAGFVLMVEYVVHHVDADDTCYLDFLQRIEEEAWDDRNFVKKALNWCLRQVGKRNQFLHRKAIACAQRLLKQPHRAAHRIARDALRELQGEDVLRRLQQKTKK